MKSIRIAALVVAGTTGLVGCTTVEKEVKKAESGKA